MKQLEDINKLLSGNANLSIKVLQKFSLESREEIEPLLQEIYETRLSSRFNEQETFLFLSACLYREEELSQKALLCLYYLAYNSDDSDFQSRIVKFCAFPENEKQEKLRARKYWILMAHLIDEEQDEEILERLYYLKKYETSDYVWNRIFGALNTWQEPWKIFPEIMSWSVYKDSAGQNYYNYIENMKDRYKECLKVQKELSQGLPQWIQLVVKGTLDYTDLNWLIEAAAEQDYGFPIGLDDFEAYYLMEDKRLRAILIYYLGIFQNNGGWESAAPWRNIVKETSWIKENPYEELNHLVLKSYGFLEGESLSCPFNEIFIFLNKQLPTAYVRSEIYESITSMLMPLLLRFLVDHQIQNPDPDQITSLFHHPSAYYGKLAASISLEAVKQGYDIGALIPVLMETFLSNTDSRAGLSAGGDIKEEDYVFDRTTCSPKGFIEFQSSGKEDGFMNLSSLTGLLEACQPANISYRTAKALRLYGEMKQDNNLLQELYKYKEENEALEDMSVANMDSMILKSQENFLYKLTPIEKNKTREEKKSAGYAYSSTGIPIGIQLGPLSIEQIRAGFTSIVKKAADTADYESEIRKFLSGQANELKDHFSLKKTSRQRNMIKAVFEGKESQLELSDLPFSRIFHRQESIGGREMILPMKYPEGSCDYLAYYRPRWSLDKEKDYLSGIYFNGRRMLNLIQTTGLQDSSLLLNTVAFHELFHAHVDLCRDSKDPVHWHKGKNPPWCRLEEAAANCMALDWLKKSKHEEMKKIEASLFELLKEKNVPGYGEYEYMDIDSPRFVPQMLHIKYHPQPPEYYNSSIIARNREDRRDNYALMTWEKLSREWGGHVIPFYINWEI